jgi:hypothetical protein
MCKRFFQNQSHGKVLIYLLLVILAAFLISIVLMLTREDPEEIFRKNSNIRVEVLNGCGVNRLAVRVTNFLRKQGFNVVRIGDTDIQDYERTAVIERGNEDMSHARYVAQRIGCAYVGKDVDPALYLDVTIIIGNDYEEIFPEIKNEF